MFNGNCLSGSNVKGLNAENPKSAKFNILGAKQLA